MRPMMRKVAAAMVWATCASFPSVATGETTFTTWAIPEPSGNPVQVPDETTQDTNSNLPPGVELATNCRHGTFLVPQKDQYIGPSLLTTGEWAEGEIQQVFRHFVGEGSVVVDVGANIGAHTIPLAQLAGPTGVVHAIEAVAFLHNLMIANAVMNGWQTVRGHHAFCGAGSSVSSSRRRVVNVNAFYGPAIPEVWRNQIHWPLNFGSLTVTERDLDAVDGTFAVDRVPTVAIDDLGLYRCDFIKIDVEGAELNVLEGAAETIRRYGPAIYLEDDRGADYSRRVTNLLAAMEYICHPHQVPVYNHQNYKNADPWEESVAWDRDRAVTSSHNQLCLPKGKHEELERLVQSWGSTPYGAPRQGEEPRTPKPFQWAPTGVAT